MRRYFALSFLLVACAGEPSAPDAFFATLSTQCGETLSGRVISEQAEDADWRKEALTLGPIACEDDIITLPLAVGSDESRIWTLERSASGLEFRHAHFEPDGRPSAVTGYGGFSEGGSAQIQAFPADAVTVENFRTNGLDRSVPNVWTFTIEADTLTYALARPAANGEPVRDFRAQFAMAD